jgi:dienelactone hydrolase
MTTSLQDEVVTGPDAGIRTRDTAASRVSESLLARVAIGLVALHIVDDNFLQPNPGISAADHLVSGLVPLAVLVLAAWAYPRLRAGARATIALVLGLFGIVAGIEAVYYATTDAGLSGDDYTGLLSLVGGVVLLVVGVVTLWRTRRRDDSLRRRYLRRALIAVGAVVVLYVLVAPFYTAYVFTHTARGFVPEPELGAPHEDVSFRTSDGLELQGWYIPSKNGAAVIAFAGRKGTQRPARMLARHGYGVLLFDRRGEGESDGDPNIFGWGGEKDVHAAVEYLEGRDDVEPGRVGGIGLSVGGEMMLEAAAESDGLKALVSDGAGIRSLREAVAVSGTSKRLQGSLVHAVVTPGVALFANTLPPPSLEDVSARITAPVFFIYAKPGSGGEAELTQTYYDAARVPKQIWLVPGAEHTGGIEAQPEEYERRVVGFFDEALLADR